MDKLYIVMPVYNEEANLRNTVESWYPLTELGEDSKLLLINDGSKDRSGEILAELAKQYPRLEYISKPNQGHGPTIRRAYAEALKRGADYIFQTDSDGQTRPDEFLPMWDAREDYAVQIGARKGRQDGFSRKIVSGVLRLVLFLFFGQWTGDPNTPFRLFKADCLREFLPVIPEDFALTNAVLSVFAKYTGVPHRYLPITFAPRQGGVNSINLPRIAKIAWTNMKRFPALNRAMRAQLTSAKQRNK